MDFYLISVPRYLREVALNIKNEQTVDAARRLAALTGESLTQAIDVAVRERLERMETDAAQTSSRLEEVIRRMQDAWGPHDGSDPTAFLYDDATGLPR